LNNIFLIFFYKLQFQNTFFSKCIFEGIQGGNTTGVIVVENIEVKSEDFLEIENSAFISCVLNNKGVLSVGYIGSVGRHSIVVLGCAFLYCNGSGIRCKNSDLNISESYFQHCFSGVHGGCIESSELLKVIISNSVFYNNSANSEGNCGGVFFSEGFNDATNVVFKSCNFSSCTCINCGGALAIFSGYFSVSECIFENCSSDNRGVTYLLFFCLIMLFRWSFCI
jgi:hypothetical protein